MLDLLSIALVFAGTLVATFLQAGVRNSFICLRELVGLLGRRFNAAKTKGELASQIRDLQKDGLIRGKATHIGDDEFDSSTSAMIETRSIDAMLARHDAARSKRFARANTSRQVCHHAAELAQVMGLAGTLIALGRMGPVDGASGGTAAAIGMAVTTTLYGVGLANLVFIPLGGLIERRSRAEDEAREDVFQWLELHANVAAPRLSPVEQDHPAARDVA